MRPSKRHPSKLPIRDHDIRSTVAAAINASALSYVLAPSHRDDNLFGIEVATNRSIAGIHAVGAAHRRRPATFDTVA